MSTSLYSCHCERRGTQNKAGTNPATALSGSECLFHSRHLGTPSPSGQLSDTIYQPLSPCQGVHRIWLLSRRVLSALSLCLRVPSHWRPTICRLTQIAEPVSRRKPGTYPRAAKAGSRCGEKRGDPGLTPGSLPGVVDTPMSCCGCSTVMGALPMPLSTHPVL